MKTSILVITVLMLAAFSAHARTWTSADGAKTFEGDLREYNPETKSVTVVVNGRLLNFTEDKLSADDVAFLKENASKPSPDESAETMADTEVGKRVTKAKLHQLEGERYRRAELTKSPEYYILYYSASW